MNCAAYPGFKLWTAPNCAAPSNPDFFAPII
jgi:hypothetical protein